MSHVNAAGWTNRRRFILLGLVGIVLFVGSYVSETRSDGFRFVEKQLSDSRSLESKLGKVQKVELPIFSSYHEKEVDSDIWINMTVRVTGTKRTAMVTVSAQRIEGKWAMGQTTINGKPL